MATRHPLVLPDLGLGDMSIAISVWLVPRGATVMEGDRLVEVLADSVTVDLPSPANGILVETLAAEDDLVVPGQVLGYVEAL
jgi:2-oxoglutarate dehydrogenase E2 component (dihydrolipoamide succinyltransferase)